MTQSTVVSETEAGHHDAATARWDDEGGASTFRPGKISDERSATLASWLVPPVVVPVFLTALIIISGIYQQLR
jgi:hypothetical protein